MCTLQRASSQPRSRSSSFRYYRCIARFSQRRRSAELAFWLGSAVLYGLLFAFLSTCSSADRLLGLGNSNWSSRAERPALFTATSSLATRSPTCSWTSSSCAYRYGKSRGSSFPRRKSWSSEECSSWVDCECEPLLLWPCLELELAKNATKRLHGMYHPDLLPQQCPNAKSRSVRRCPFGRAVLTWRQSALVTV